MSDVSVIRYPITIEAIELQRNIVELPNDGMDRRFAPVVGKHAVVATIFAAKHIRGSGSGASAEEALGAALITAVRSAAQKNVPTPIQWRAAG